MNEPLISLIVPAYKAEDTIERAIISIEKQTFKGPFEVLLMLRDSGDKTIAIAQKYVDKNPERYRLYALGEIGTLGYSRLKGVSLAKGKYVYFLDGDDELAPNAFEVLYGTMEKTGCDVANCSFSAIREGGKIEKNIFVKKGTMNKEETMDAFLHDVSFRGFLWCKMFKRELFYKGPLLYLAKKKDMFEDVALVTSLLSYADKVVSIKDPLYLYHKDNPGSGTTIKRTDRTLSHLGVYALQRHFLEKVWEKELAPCFFRHRLRMWSMLFYDEWLDKKAGCSKDYLKQARKERKEVFSKKPLPIKGQSYEEMFSRALIEDIDTL